jgi:hypothetical protein
VQGAERVGDMFDHVRREQKIVPPSEIRCRSVASRKY